MLNQNNKYDLIEFLSRKYISDIDLPRLYELFDEIDERTWRDDATVIEESEIEDLIDKREDEIIDYLAETADHLTRKKWSKILYDPKIY